MVRELLMDYHFGLHQLTEILGHACAVAISKVCKKFVKLIYANDHMGFL